MVDEHSLVLENGLQSASVNAPHLLIRAHLDN